MAVVDGRPSRRGGTSIAHRYKPIGAYDRPADLEAGKVSPFTVQIWEFEPAAGVRSRSLGDLDVPLLSVTQMFVSVRICFSWKLMCLCFLSRPLFVPRSSQLFDLVP